MSTIRKIPYIESVIGSLSAAQRTALKNAINKTADGTDANYSFLQGGINIPSSYRIECATIQLARDRQRNGILVYTSRYCVFLVYGDSQKITIYNLDRTTKTYELVEEYCDIEELRTVLRELDLEDTKSDSFKLTVTLANSDGSVIIPAITGTTISVYDSKDNKIAEQDWNGSSVEFKFAQDTVYRLESSSAITSGSTIYFNPHGSLEGVLLGNTSVVIYYSTNEDMETLSDVKAFLALSSVTLAQKRAAIVRTETNPFSINISIKNPDTGTSYTMPIIFTEVSDAYTQKVNNKTITFTGAKCQFAFAIPDSMVFDDREQVRANGERFSSDLSYYTTTSATPGDNAFTALTANSDYIPGDYVDDYESAHSGVYVYKHAYSNNKFGTGGLVMTNALRYGLNIYHESNIHKYLNGSGLDWWEATHVGDVLASGYSGKYGFEDWFDEDDLSQVRKNSAWGVYEIPGAELTNNTLYADFVLPSGTEIAGSVNANEGTVFDYWKYLNGGVISNDANANRTIKKVTAQASAQYAWLRSPNRSYSYYAWRLDASGYISASAYCYNSYAVLPGFII